MYKTWIAFTIGMLSLSVFAASEPSLFSVAIGADVPERCEKPAPLCVRVGFLNELIIESDAEDPELKLQPEEIAFFKKTVEPYFVYAVAPQQAVQVTVEMILSHRRKSALPAREQLAGIGLVGVGLFFLLLGLRRMV